MSTSQETFDPARRRLCPDGACIGLLDDGGRCKVCGREGGPASPVEAGAPGPTEPRQEDEDDARMSSDDTGDGEAFDSTRKLCPDGACIGVISDGRCSVCGRAEEG